MTPRVMLEDSCENGQNVCAVLTFTTPITAPSCNHVYCSLAGQEDACGFSVEIGFPHSSAPTGVETG